MKTSKLIGRQNKSRSLKKEFAKGFLIILLVIIIIGADYYQARNNNNVQFRSGSSELRYMEHQPDALTIFELKYENLMTDRSTWNHDYVSSRISLADALIEEPEKSIELEDWMFVINP